MKLRFLFVGLALCFSATALAAPPSIKEAEKMALSGKYESAIISLRKIAYDKKQSAATQEEALVKLINYIQIQASRLSKDERTTYLSAFKDDYKALIALRPDDGKVYFDYGNFLHQIAELTSALDAYSKALYLGYKQAAVPLGKAYYDRRDYENAIPLLQIATQVKPSDYELWFHLGWSQRELNDFDAAVDSLGKSYAIYNAGNFARDDRVIRSYSLTLIEVERYNEAITLAMKYSTLRSDVEGFLFVATIYSGANQPDNAIFYYARALDAANKIKLVAPTNKTIVDPKYLSLVLNNYAWLFCTAKDKKYQSAEYLLKAFHMATKAVEVSERKKPEYLDTLAEVYYLLGYPEEAISLEKEAAEKDPSKEFYREQLVKFEAALNTRPPVLVASEELAPTNSTLLPEKNY